MFYYQTQWIVDNVKKDIILFLHEGDLVKKDGSAQWIIAHGSMNPLDDYVPWARAYNHQPKEQNSTSV